MTLEEFKQALQAERFDPPVPVERDSTYALGVHDHPFDAFAFITEGEITLEVGGVSTTYRPGETFRLAAGTPHTEAAGPQGVRYLSGRRAQP